MLIPVGDPLYQADGKPFQEKMIAYIRQHFAGQLGDRDRWLDQPNGLDRLAKDVQAQVQQRRAA